jgi:glutaredoxin-dependent peroxiredoxin
MTRPEVGDRAPDFTLTSHEMKQVSLGEYMGRKVVLAFYPGAFTSACRKEMCTLRDSIAQLEELDAQVLGISVNDPFSNKAFHEENVLNFPLLSDYTRETIRQYGVYKEDFAGLKGYTTAKRSVFILDPQGVIRYIWISEDPGVQPDHEEIRKQLEKL